jgi:hypothetical protein
MMPRHKFTAESEMRIGIGWGDCSRKIVRVCLGGHPNTRSSGHGEVKFAPFLLREGGLRGCQKSEIGKIRDREEGKSGG